MEDKYYLDLDSVMIRKNIPDRLFFYESFSEIRLVIFVIE